MEFPYQDTQGGNGGSSTNDTQQINYIVLDEKMCIVIAEKVPVWSRHLQRLCGKLEGQVPLSKKLMDNIMGCQFQCEGDVLTSRWAGGLIQGFCTECRSQLTRDNQCDHPRCHALQSARPPGKLCFMELIEAVAAALPKRIVIGDSIDTATWGQFIVMDDYSKYWLNDYSTYFSDVCGSS